ncbi:type I secretion system permease/ATPase [Shimwellia blattae]|uniref:Toxin RTX-I translocation ATP-binding protein n=1 Tax=Shimwellia blattae (strain ATCC 29907 / DSM 4481 / JCM 1650 / NBRC 105725 / CDC 9005-74) TaxID=630626 RepID=I2BCA8_SHIBC|nr:type I secretion system permease/ATPase [Shimwellia blattae]AFJ48162.1 toxin RTX-I translocation ATP-binding protein [Shimwellia blattae DSM 4481 = NBRC 105725]GAB82722.1 putative ATP-binding protein [Shimwellia blattae DSM 4481 = NBRC 105725]VDY65660.1 RTX-I toxin determinant B [Shimwellia blattae]VEC25266.1 RTX-I toxin determinant B [Shimwellia blattae]
MALHSVSGPGEDYADTPEDTGIDPRSLHDDPLLDSLLAICTLHGIAASRISLTAGLPLKNNRLTMDVFARAAARANLRARLLRRDLKKITAISLPAILMLRENRTAVLLGWNDDGQARLLPSEAGGGEVQVDPGVLAGEYTGVALFIQPLHQRERGRSALIPRTKTWFRDTLRLSRTLYSDAIVASFLINIIALCTPLFVMNVYDRVVPNQATATLWVLAIGITVAFLFDLLLKTLRGRALDLAGKKTDMIVSASLFSRINGMAMKARPTRLGSFAQNIHEIQSLRDFLSSLTQATLIDLPFTLLMLLVIGLIGGPLVFIPLVAFPLALGVSWLIQKPLNETIDDTMKLASERQAVLIETLSGLDAVKVNNAQSERQYLWENTLGALSKKELRVKTLSTLAVNFTAWLQQFSGVAMIVAGVYLIINGNLSMGGLIACYMLNGRALAPMGQLSSLMTRYQQARMTIETTDSMMDLPQERQDDRPSVARERLQGAIAFQNVTFTYPDQKHSSLKQISFSIAAGERVGIIGRSGSGKSSLAKLIIGFYQPDSGEILIDGMDANQIDVSDLRHNIGYVPQDIYLFSGTLRENLLSGASYVDDDAMLRVSRLAGVHEFARKHPDGYNMQVGERGLNLSGGQRQAVVLARALLLDPPILLLDEPTSSMDNTTEDAVRRALMETTRDRTLLLVTHRASLLPLVDRLIIVERGHIIADGPRDNVLAALKKGQIHASH